MFRREVYGDEALDDGVCGDGYCETEYRKVIFVVGVRGVFACVVLLAVEAYDAKPADAHRLGHYAVRGGNIRYNNGPDFDFFDARNFAVNQWNRLNRIPIQPHVRGTDLDLQFRQYPGTSGPYRYDDAYYDWTPADVDLIWFNTRLWKCPRPCLSAYDREAVAVHELGHALNLNHVPAGTPSIMFYDAAATRFHGWQRHDKYDYNTYW